MPIMIAGSPVIFQRLNMNRSAKVTPASRMRIGPMVMAGALMSSPSSIALVAPSIWSTRPW